MITREQIVRLQRRADAEESYAIAVYMATYHPFAVHRPPSTGARVRSAVVSAIRWTARALSGAYRRAVAYSERRR